MARLAPSGARCTQKPAALKPDTAGRIRLSIRALPAGITDATLTRETIRIAGQDIDKLTVTTPDQRRAFDWRNTARGAPRPPRRHRRRQPPLPENQPPDRVAPAAKPAPASATRKQAAAKKLIHNRPRCHLP